MAKSCKGLAMELVKCLSETDCVKVGRLRSPSFSPIHPRRRLTLLVSIRVGASVLSCGGHHPQASAGRLDPERVILVQRWSSRGPGYFQSPDALVCRCRKGRTRSAPGRKCPTLPASALACGRPTSTARGARCVLILANYLY
jgi:hypothetical protein